MVPFAVTYIFNWFSFIIVSRVTYRHQKERKLGTKLKQCLKIGAITSQHPGLGWGVGLVATTSIPSVPVSVILQAILYTSFQGLGIFVTQVVHSGVVRAEWRSWPKLVIIITLFECFDAPYRRCS